MSVFSYSNGSYTVNADRLRHAKLTAYSRRIASQHTYFLQDTPAGEIY